MGDCVYALYTVKALGGGDVFLSLFHRPGWDESMAKSMLPLLQYQDYIGRAALLPLLEGEIKTWRACGAVPDEVKALSHNLHNAEKDRNPEAFPEWHGKCWPGNCHIAKRYAVHFGVEWNPNATWLTAPMKKGVDVVFHMPMRRMVRTMKEWGTILSALYVDGHCVVIIGGDDLHEWNELRGVASLIRPTDFLQAADYINSARLFMGGASSCNTVAEGLKRRRIVELADGCDDTYPYGSTGWCANDMSTDEVIALARRLVG